MINFELEVRSGDMGYHAAQNDPSRPYFSGQYDNRLTITFVDEILSSSFLLYLY